MKILNLKKHITLSTLFAAGTMLSCTAFAEEISNGDDLADIIADNANPLIPRTGTLTGDINATKDLGELNGTQLTIDGGTNKYAISGTYQVGGVDKNYCGITIDSTKLDFDQTLIIKNVVSWNGFAKIIANREGYSVTEIYGGAIFNDGTVTIEGSTFSKNYAKAIDSTHVVDHNIFADADAYGGAIYNEKTLTITGSTFSENYAFSTSHDGGSASAEGGAIYSRKTVTIEGSTFSKNYATSMNSAAGGSIYNDETLTITDSNFSENYAKATNATAVARGGAIFNSEGRTVNIIAKDQNSRFSGNYTEVNGTQTNNDIYNFKGTTNLYAASEKTISFEGGIKSFGTSSVKINVNGEGTTYDVTGTVLFENGSVNSGNNFELGAGTLKIENGVTWTNNTLALNGGTLDIETLDYVGGSLTLNADANINIDISETGYDQIVFSDDAQFILTGGKITVDLNKNVYVNDEFEILKNFILGESSQNLSPLVVEVTNAPGYILAASTITGETTGTNSLLLKVTAIPEPSMFGLFAGLAALALVGTRRRRK